MFPMGVIRVILVDEQPVFQAAIQHQFQNQTGFELCATGTHLTEIEPLIQQHQPHMAILAVPSLPSGKNPPHETGSFITVLQRLQQEAYDVKILILANHLDPALIANLDPLNIHGYLLKQDPRTLHLPEVLHILAPGGGFISSEAVLQAKNEWLDLTAEKILTDRQLDILNTVLSTPNSSYAQHAEHLSITESTWDTHLSSIYSRLKVNNLTAAILRAVELGLISLCHLSPTCPQNGCAPNKQTNKQTNPELPA